MFDNDFSSTNSFPRTLLPPGYSTLCNLFEHLIVNALIEQVISCFFKNLRKKGEGNYLNLLYLFKSKTCNLERYYIFKAVINTLTAQKMKFFNKDFFTKCDQIRRVSIMRFFDLPLKLLTVGVNNLVIF